MSHRIAQIEWNENLLYSLNTFKVDVEQVGSRLEMINTVEQENIELLKEECKYDGHQRIK